MGEDRLTDEEVARVLRRATELEAGSPLPGVGDGLPLAAVEAAAAEVGLSPAAVRQAVAELRTGALDAPGAQIVCARVVPLACSDALAAVGRWLGGQAMIRARDRVTEQVWRPREDWVARTQRRFDWAAAIRLRAVDEVVVRAVEVEGGTLVRVCVQLERPVAAAPRIGAALAGGTGAAGLGLLGLLNGQPEIVFTALGVGAGGSAGGYAGWRIGSRLRARERRKVSEAVDGLLDELEHGREPGRNPFDKLASRARRLRGGWSA